MFFKILKERKKEYVNVKIRILSSLMNIKKKYRNKIKTVWVIPQKKIFFFINQSIIIPVNKPNNSEK